MGVSGALYLTSMGFGTSDGIPPLLRAAAAPRGSPPHLAPTHSALTSLAHPWQAHIFPRSTSAGTCMLTLYISHN